MARIQTSCHSLTASALDQGWATENAQVPFPQRDQEVAGCAWASSPPFGLRSCLLPGRRAQWRVRTAALWDWVLYPQLSGSSTGLTVSRVQSTFMPTVPLSVGESL